MTYRLEDFQSKATSADNAEKDRINGLFEKYKKEMLFLRNFSEMTLRLYQEVFDRWQRHVGAMPTEDNRLLAVARRDKAISIVSFQEPGLT